MKNAIILHGTCDQEEYYSDKYPSSSNSHWLPWLQKQLLIKGVSTVTPEMPNAHTPDYSVWKREFERFDVTSETILVGHSCGGGFLVRWLSENKDTKVGTVVLVAPWLDPDREKTTDFFDFVVDIDLADRTKKLVVFNSRDDDDDIQKSVQKITSDTENVKVVEFEKHGHFTLSDMGTEKFPELLNELVD